MKHIFSFKKIITYIFLSIFVSIGMLFVVNIHYENSIDAQYQKIAYVSSLIGEIHNLLSESNFFFEQYKQTTNIQHYKDYIHTNNRIFSLIQEIDMNEIKNENIILFSRVLHQIIEGQSKHIQDKIIDTEFNAEDYANFEIAKEYMTAAQNIFSNFSISYMHRSNQLYQKIQQDYENIRFFQYSIFIIVFVFHIFLIGYFFRDITTTLDKLSFAALCLSKRQWDIPDLPSSKYKELDGVNMVFNNMKNSTAYYVQQMKEKAIMEIELHKQILENQTQQNLLLESKYKILQMQINPHFLFNTLNLIAHVVQDREIQKATRLIKAVSNILRKSLSTEELFVSVQEELETLKSYLEILNERFTDRIYISLDADEIPNNIYIPPFTLQPLVENSIIHGLKNRVKDGKINIKCTDATDVFYITITDNGDGNEQSYFDNILNNSSKEHIGLYNIYTRLQKYYDYKDVMTISSKPNVGTVVSLTLRKQG